jgi:hypothetical protein
VEAPFIILITLISTTGSDLTRSEKLGRMFADLCMEAAHQRYNAPMGIAIVNACIKRLQERIGEIKPKKATKEYKEARYGKK